MIMTAPQPMIDPLDVFIAGAFGTGMHQPIPLVATRFDVHIDGGLAVVSTTRTFRNAEDESIEATITFPVPVHAVLFELEARIAGRVVCARAQRKSDARGTYEDAIESGKSAVLHEEVLRGVHMLSVAHVPPGAEVEVSATWAITLTNVNGRGHLRIPLTVGDIYGGSGLPDSDELIHGGPAQMADLTIRCQDGTVTLLGRTIDEGKAQVPTNAPIDLEVSGWTPRDLCGRAADGRTVSLRVDYTATEENPLNAALLIDHSGSMGGVCSGDHHSLTKHQAIVSGLQNLASSIGKSDFVELWEFDDSLNRIGSTSDQKSWIKPANPGKNLLGLISRLSGPSGGN